jgi:lipoate-protein ligase B
MKFEDWGLVDYSASFQKQLDLVAEIAAGTEEERVVFCTHPPVVTLGRGASPTDLSGWQGEVVEINRGGKATYHGPSQIVIYPLLDLKKERALLPVRDVGAYLRGLENWMIEALAVFDLQAEARQAPKGEENSYTGVWVGEHKVASIGIAVKKWITHHGAALNLSEDPTAFQGISPCGFKRSVMSSVETERGLPVSYEEMKQALISVCRW